jgi:predicted phage terminase large subunit-like protein
MSDFHMKYYRVLHRFATGEIRKLIITVPPQHGKSEGSTRLLPAFIFGLNPDCKMAIASYSDTFAKRFNRDIQRIIDNPTYRKLFPDTRLNEKNIVTIATAPLRNSSDFEIVNRLGSLKAVGRGGSLTGNPVDIMILDDLYSNAMEGNSPTVREAVWEWYTSVVKTRLHNSSQELIVFTRWNEDDLIGRIEQKERVIELNSFDQIDPAYDGWYKLNFEAIKESEPTELDQREIGAPLWPDRHSLKLLGEKRALDRHQFDCMYQGHPASKEGALYGDDFQTYTTLPETIKKANYTDTADVGADKLCSICYEVSTDGLVYITDVLYTSEPMEITEPATAQMLLRNGTKEAYIESNNGGRGFARTVQVLAPPVAVEWFHQRGGKESRILTNAATVLQMVRMPVDWKLRWPQFAGDLITYKRMFQANPHDDAADTVTGIVEREADVATQFNRIYQFKEDMMTMRMYNIYGLNPGAMAPTGIVHVGFGGDYTVNIRELCYARGLGTDDIFVECQKIIDMHTASLKRIMACLKPGQDQHLAPMQLVPHILIDGKNSELIGEIDRQFNYRVRYGQCVKDVNLVIVTPRGGETKEQSIEAIRVLKQVVDPDSVNYVNEASKYRYNTTNSNAERIPVGNDSLLEAARMALSYVVGSVFKSQPRALTFDLTRQQIYDQFKHLTI